jgi:AraC-like DNA-binding protein
VINDIQSYIKENIREKISLLDISKSINYSLWYTARIFKEVMGITIFEYIRKLRLTQAAIKLRDTSSKVIDVAFDFVFDSHEGFTRAFAKEFNITPKTYQKAPIPLQYFTPFDVVDNSNRKGKQTVMSNKAVFVQIVERPKRKAIIRRGINAKHYFEYCEEVDCSIWGVLCSIKEAISEPVGMWLSKKLQKPNTSLYVQGVEVPDDYSGIVPEDCELIDLPKTKMLIFQGETYDDEFFEDEVSEVMKFVSKYNPQVHGYNYDESGYRFQYEPQGYRGYIEGRTVKPIK